MSALIRPVPISGADEDRFWAFIAEDELRIQRCDQCGHLRFPPASHCPLCLADEATWSAMSGRATVLSWAVFRRTYFPGMPAPYAVVAGLLEEGPLLVANLAEVDLVGLRQGDPIEVSFEDGTFEDGSTRRIHQWRRPPGDGGPR